MADPRTHDERFTTNELAEILGRRGYSTIREFVVRHPHGHRRVDLAVWVVDQQVWVEMETPNYRGNVSRLRDLHLAALAAEHNAVLIHWYMGLPGDGEDLDPLVARIIDRVPTRSRLIA